MSELTLIERPDGTLVNDTGNDPAVAQIKGHRRYWIGVDLASQVDFTAIVALLDEQLPILQEGKVVLGPRTLTATYADRFKGVDYPSICNHLARLMAAKPFAGKCKLVIDGSGLGAVVSDILVADNVPHTAITMTAGQNWSEKGRKVSVGKTLLIETLSVLFASGDLKFATGLKLRQEIEQDLASFSLTETAAGNQIITQSRQSGSHGDLGIALAISGWCAEYRKPKFTGQGQVSGWF